METLAVADALLSNLFKRSDPHTTTLDASGTFDLSGE
jgi:hypothetical protein